LLSFFPKKASALAFRAAAPLETREISGLTGLRLTAKNRRVIIMQICWFFVATIGNMSIIIVIKVLQQKISLALIEGMFG